MDPTISSDELNRQGVTLLAIRPHPDDESTSTGGMLALYNARHVRTGVVICTGGEEGQIHDPDLDQVADKPSLAEIREREVRDACMILGVSALRMLGYRDSGMPDTLANQHPKAFINAERVEATGHLARIIRELRPSIIATEPPGGLYAHPDHVMCHQVSVDAFQASGDPHAFPEAGPPWRVAKLYAIAQIDDGCWEALLPAFSAAGIDTAWLKRRPQPSRMIGPEMATVALYVGPYSELQRQALLAHRTQIPRESFFGQPTVRVASPCLRDCLLYSPLSTQRTRRARGGSFRRSGRTLTAGCQATSQIFSIPLIGNPGPSGCSARMAL